MLPSYGSSIVEPLPTYQPPSERHVLNGDEYIELQEHGQLEPDQKSQRPNSAVGNAGNEFGAQWIAEPRHQPPTPAPASLAPPQNAETSQKTRLLASGFATTALVSLIGLITYHGLTTWTLSHARMCKNNERGLVRNIEAMKFNGMVLAWMVYWFFGFWVVASCVQKAGFRAGQAGRPWRYGSRMLLAWTSLLVGMFIYWLVGMELLTPKCDEVVG